MTSFEFDEQTLSDGTLRVLRFEGYSIEWVRFIKANRQIRNLEYDVVIGPIANDDVRTQFALHMMGEITPHPHPGAIAKTVEILSARPLGRFIRTLFISFGAHQAKASHSVSVPRKRGNRRGCKDH